MILPPSASRVLRPPWGGRPDHRVIRPICNDCGQLVRPRLAEHVAPAPAPALPADQPPRSCQRRPETPSRMNRMKAAIITTKLLRVSCSLVCITAHGREYPAQQDIGSCVRSDLTLPRQYRERPIMAALNRDQEVQGAEVAESPRPSS